MTNKQKGIITIITAAFSFALMSLFIRLSGDLPFIQKSFFRNIIAASIALVLFLKSDSEANLNSKSLKTILLRSTFGTIGIFCNFYAVDNLILSDATLLNKLSPFFVVVFSYLILKEKISAFQALCIIGAFVGSLFIIKPTFANASLFPSLIGLLGGICAGLAYVMVRRLGEQGVSKAFIVFFFSAFSTIVSIPFIVFNFQSMELVQVFYLILAGLCATAGQFAITAAYNFAPGREISIYDYTQIIFSTILGFIFFLQIPDVYSIIGYAIIIAMAVLMYLYNVKGMFNKEDIAYENNN